MGNGEWGIGNGEWGIGNKGKISRDLKKPEISGKFYTYRSHLSYLFPIHYSPSSIANLYAIAPSIKTINSPEKNTNQNYHQSPISHKMSEITANYDEPWKAAIGDYFQYFLSFFYPEIHGLVNWQKNPISLDKELEQITAYSRTEKRYADRLFKVWLLDDREVWILIHIEVQSQYDKEFPQRMFIYNYRAFDLYRKPVIGLAILGDENQSWRPSYYEYGVEKSQMRLDFSTVKLLDYQWEELEESDNPFALVVMAHLRTKSTTSNLTEREQWKWQLVRSLYERGLTKFDVIKLFKVVDKMMTLTPELQQNLQTKIERYEEETQMPFLSTLEEMALERGEEKGARSTSKKYIVNLLQKRFGEVPENLIETINQIDDISLLEQLVLETIGVTSIEEFEELTKGNYLGQN